MSDAINTQNRLRNTGVSGDTKAGSTAKTKLSSTTLIEELSEQIKNLPEVNEARVEAIKQAIGKGEYQTDAEVIARKYSEIEKLLP
jgi:flagellar biosynthesis anti-sigma factor FlgM